MDVKAVLARLNAERIGLQRSNELLELDGDVVRRVIDGEIYMVESIHLQPDHADEAIEHQIVHHRNLGVGFEWKVLASDRPSDLMARLVQHGFEVGEKEAVVVIDADKSLLDGENVHCQVQRVADETSLATYKRLAEEIFGKDYTVTTNALRRGIELGSSDHVGYIGHIDGEPATIGRLYTHPDSAFGGLYGGGTLPRFRSRGCYRATVASRMEDARRLGAEFALVDALPTSLPILLRLGFKVLIETWPCTWHPR